MNRYNFLDIFQENPDGSLTPKIPISINGVVAGLGVTFQNGVSFGGIDIHKYKYFPIAGIEHDDFLEIKGFYQK